MRWKLTASILTMAVIAGCSGENPLEQGKRRRGPAPQVGGQLAPVLPPPPAPPPEAPSNEQPQDADAQSAPPPPPPPPANPQTPVKPDPNATREQARPGVTGKGNYGPGPITTPIATYFITRERIVFDIEIANAMKMYKAFNGHFPKTHEEFMEKIIKENSIRLPKLSPGDRYIYDAEKAAKMKDYDPKDPPLMVERARQGAVEE